MSSPLAPVGVFDSGVGGLTVARAIIDQLPDEDIVYVGDTGNGPYGPLTIPEIRAHALAIGDDLVERGVKALVIACNSASAACLRDARERYDVPVVEVILPSVSSARRPPSPRTPTKTPSPPHATPRSPRWPARASSTSSSAG
jgi:glutamate racemase